MLPSGSVATTAGAPAGTATSAAAASRSRARLPGLAATGMLAGILALCAAACARPLRPAEPSAAALYRDLERLVSLRAAAGWQIDRVEIDALLPDVLMSACQVQPAQRALLRDWLDTRIAALSGPVEQAYTARDRDLGRVSELLALSRVRMTLDRAMNAAGADCPFWLEPRSLFRGRQISDDRWQISLSGGGSGMVVSRGSEQDLQFGGSGRVLFGRNLGSALALYLGLEAGGSASFPKTDTGERSKLVLALDAGAPAIARYRMLNTHVDLELGYLVHATEEDWGQVEHGLHLGVAFGGRASRVRWFFPGAALTLAYERTFPDDAPDLHMIKMGFRAMADFDL